MDNFSYKGLTVLFESLEEMAQDCETDIEMDVIALCCDYNEASVNDIISDYRLDVSDCEDEDDKCHLVSDYLNNNTGTLGGYELDGITHFLYQVF